MRTSPVGGAMAMVILAACAERPTTSAPEILDGSAPASVVLPVSGPTQLPGIGGTQDLALSVNDADVVVGESNGRAVVWRSGVASQLPDIPLGGSDVGIAVRATDVNGRGQIVGEFASGGVTGAALWSPDGLGGYVGVDLGTIAAGGFIGRATTINGFGQVAGTFRVYTSPDNSTWEDRCFLWTPARQNSMAGSLADIGTLGGTFCVANDINTAGQVVGASLDASLTTFAFIWKPNRRNATTGTMARLMSGEFSSYAAGINDAGQVTGFRIANGTAPEAAFVWTPPAKSGAQPTIVDLPLPAGSQRSQAQDIDAGGNVVGFLFDGAVERGFFWNGSYTMLPGFTGTGTETISPAAMNGVGTVVGISLDGSARVALRWAVTLQKK